MNTINQFLKTCDLAEDLNDRKFDGFFPEKVKRSDFLLFGKKIVCESKEIENVDFPKRAARLAGEEAHFTRRMYNPISKTLSAANDQIVDTKRALGCMDALGLVILENLIPNDCSVLTLIDAAERKMQLGLAEVDGVLCIDRVNTFQNPEDATMHLSYLITRDTSRAGHLWHLFQVAFTDFTDRFAITVFPFSLKSAKHFWKIGAGKRYLGYSENRYPILHRRETKVMSSWIVASRNNSVEINR